MRMVKKVIKTVVLFLLFAVLLAMGLMIMNLILIKKDTSGVQSKFAKLERDSIDTIFIGNSHQYCTIDPDLLHDEYGMETFMLATAAQTVPMSYYAAMEAIEFQHPKTIIFEVCYCANNFRTVTTQMSHFFFDRMPYCKARTLALKDLIVEDKIYFYLPLGTYHGRWKELTREDFRNKAVTDRGGVHYEKSVWNSEIPLVEPDDIKPMPPEMERYMDLLVDICRENNVELIMYAAPFNTFYTDDEGLVQDLLDRERIFNYVGVYCEKKGIEYHNLFYELDALGLDDTDWSDRQHMNCNGQEKVTRYMAEMGYIR